MFCPKCGKSLVDNTKFCENCGAPTNMQAAAPPPTEAPPQYAPPQYAAPPYTPPQYSQPQYAAPQFAAPQYAAPQYASQPNAAPPRKKKHIGCLVAVVIFLAVVGTVAWFVMSLLGVFGAKNLGVEYTEKDYQSAMTKIGTKVTFEGKSGAALKTYTEQLKKDGTKFPIDEYIWKHSDYQEKSFQLTSAEATALLNEIAPAFWWFEGQQIRTLPGGKIEASGTLLLEKAIDDLYPEMREEIPIPIFEQVNLYAKGKISIVENKLDLDADEFQTGPIEGVSADTLDENAKVFEALYTSVPGLIIHSLKVNSSGNIEVSALIPQVTEIVRR